MNIFVLDENPIRAAEMMCDKHIPKMVVESAQMMASAVRRWGATDDVMPLTKAGKPPVISSLSKPSYSRVSNKS